MMQAAMNLATCILFAHHREQLFTTVQRIVESVVTWHKHSGSINVLIQLEGCAEGRRMSR